MKSNETLYKAIGEINEMYLPDLNKKKKGPVKFAVIGGVMAALVALGLCLPQAVRLINNPVREWESVFPASSYDPENTFIGTEKLPFADREYRISSVQYDYTDEISSGNPWNEETAPTLLPIFKSQLTTGKISTSLRRYYNKEQLKGLIEKAATALGTSIKEDSARQDDIGYYGSAEYLLADYYREQDIPWCYYASCDGAKFGKDNIELSVNSEICISVLFGGGSYGSTEYTADFLKLPEGCSLSPHASEKETHRALDYITENFNRLFQFENPVKTVSRSNNAVYGSRIFNMTDDNVQNILNYNFSYAEAGGYSNTENSLSVIYIYNKLCTAEYLGDYPLISPEEAKEMLIDDGYYLYDYDKVDFIKKENEIKAEDIKRIELEYFETGTNYYVPHYIIYAETKEAAESGSIYQKFTLPAVKEEYFQPPEDKHKANYSEKIVNAAPDTDINTPDGGRLNKEDAIGTDGDTANPVLEFDVGYFRFAKPVFENTLDDPHCYDFESGKGKEDFDLETRQSEWYKIQAGDIINSNFTVKSAETKVRWLNGKQDIFESKIELDGSITVDGLFFCVSETDLRQRSVIFIPDPTKGVKIPVIYTAHKSSDWNVSEGEAYISDTQGIQTELPDELYRCFDNAQLVKGKATLSNIILSYNETANIFSAKLEDFEISE